MSREGISTTQTVIIAVVVIAVVVGAGAWYMTRPPEIPPGEEEEEEEEPPVVGATPAERAINAAKELVKDAPKKSLTIYSVSGAVPNLEAVIPIWEEETGIDVEIHSAPAVGHVSEVMRVGVTKTSEYDLFEVFNFAIPDYVESEIVVDITDYARKYDPELTGPRGIVTPNMYYTMLYGGRLYGVLCDGDGWNLNLNKNFLEDEDYQAEYEEEYGMPLRPPKTWEEFDQQVKFFGEKDGIYGGCLYRSAFAAPWMFNMRFHSTGKMWFDDEMHPQINSEEGVKALEEMVEVMPYLKPGHMEWSLTEPYPLMAEGDTYAYMAWPSFYMFMHDPETAGEMVDRMLPTQVPGRRVMPDGGILRATMNAVGGETLFVSKYSKVPELAYCLLQFIADPDMSITQVAVPAGWNDPYRRDHFTSPEIAETYGEEYPPVAYVSQKQAVPEMELRGGVEYDTVLGEYINSAVRGKMSAQEALDAAAKEWEEITERYTRASQLLDWEWLRTTFPENIRELNDLPGPELPDFMQE